MFQKYIFQVVNLSISHNSCQRVFKGGGWALVRRQNEGSFGCEVFARAVGQPNVPECRRIHLLSSCLFAANLPLSLSFFQLVPNILNKRIVFI